VTTTPAIGPDGTIYVTSRDAYAYALRPDGTKLWDFDTFSSILSSPALAADGTIYFGSHDNQFYAVNADGSLQWSFAAEDFVPASPVISEDGHVYFGSRDNHLYAIKVPSGLAESPWPMYRGDVRHTGRAKALTTELRFTAPSLLANGILEWTLLGPAGGNYTIESTSDFVNWTPLTNLTSAAPQTRLQDSSVGGAERRFYRAVAK